MTDKTHVSIRHINKVYGDGTHALRDICLDVREGEILVLLGSSGCGKSTLLRTIGGLEKKTSGEIYFYDQEISSVPVEKRNVGFVFQNYALFPTMTVRQNIAFGLKLRKLPREQIEQKVQQLLDMMDLNPYAGKKPGQLSGGQQQRVAIARVLAIEPKVLLMDEPLTALDAKLKEYLRIQLGKQLRQFGITTIYVTHPLYLLSGECGQLPKPQQRFKYFCSDEDILLDGIEEHLYIILATAWRPVLHLDPRNAPSNKR